MVKNENRRTRSANEREHDDGRREHRFSSQSWAPFWRPALAIVFVVLIVALPLHQPTLAQEENPTDELALSPYWKYAVSRWESIILQEAERRSLDPDLIAALIWKESMGRADAQGPAGAIGLMMVMPFPWRPSPEELRDPWTNVFWGARALAHTIRDGNGDVYYALAAYNGSWSQIHLRVTRRYATSVIDEYTRALAVKKGLAEDGDWTAIMAIQGLPGARTITVLGPQQPLKRYTERPWGQADIPAVPSSLPPDAVAIAFESESCAGCQVNVWLVAGDDALSAPYTTRSSFPHETSYARTRRLPVPGVGPADATMISPANTPAPEETPTVTSTPVSPTPTEATTPTTPTATVAFTSPTPIVPTPTDTPIVPTTPPTPTVVPTETPTQTVPVACDNGPLSLEAWYLDRVKDENGWTATIYVLGSGGDCVYTYAWNGEVKGEALRGALTFQVSHTDPYAVIMGTASVTSAGQIAEVPLWIEPPD